MSNQQHKKTSFSQTHVLSQSMSHQQLTISRQSHSGTDPVPLVVLSILIKKRAVSRLASAETKKQADDSAEQVGIKRRADAGNESKRPRPAGLGRGKERERGSRASFFFTSHLCQCLTAISRTWDGFRSSVLPGMADGAFRIVLCYRWRSVVCLVVARVLAGSENGEGGKLEGFGPGEGMNRREEDERQLHSHDWR